MAGFLFNQRFLSKATMQRKGFFPKGFQKAASPYPCLQHCLTKKKRKLALGGFSQGAMIAAHMALSGLVKPTALLLFSGVY